jgi:hypothetical protein
MRILLKVLSILLLPICFFANESYNFYKNVVRIARSSIGLKHIPDVNGKKFTSDCIGFVRYVYFLAGIDITRVYENGRGGVSSLYYGLYRRNWVYRNLSVQIGDLIFFDNTYDANRDRKWNDELTHIGIVSGFGKHNTIFFIHYASGVVKEDRMNLSYPNTYAFRQKDGKLYVINSHLRVNRNEGYAKKDYLTSAFFRCFGRIPVRIKK